MKSFALTAVFGAASASYGLGSRSYGTTGHYGNQYGHAGRDDHAHNDHIYGYDSVATVKSLKEGALQARNVAKGTSIQTAVGLANDERIAYLDKVYERRIQRFNEINMQVIREIRAPFEYQRSLLNKERDDVVVALTEALLDSNNAYSDMIDRIERLRDDKVAAMQDEVDEILQAVERAPIDKKRTCDVIRALRADILKNVVCNAAGPTVTYDTADTLEFREYEGLFDDFHYDIGHGKGTGEGKVDSAPVVDGYGGRAPVSGPVGDYEMDIGAPTRSWEGKLYSQPKY